MMSRMKIIIRYLLLVLVIGVLVFFYYRGYAISSFIPQLEGVISSGLKQKVSVKNLYFRLPNRVVASGILVHPKDDNKGFFGKVDSATFYVNLFNVIKKKKVSPEDIYTIKIDKPHLMTQKGEKSGEIPELSNDIVNNIKNIYLPKILIRRARVDFHVGAKEVSVMDLDLDFRVIDGICMLDSKVWGLICANLSCNFDTGLVRLGVKSRGSINISHLLKMLDIENLSGYVNINVKTETSLENFLGLNWREIDLDGKILLYDLGLETKWAGFNFFVKNLNSKIVFEEKSVHVEDTRGLLNDMGVMLDIKTGDFFKDIENFSFHITDISLDSIYKFKNIPFLKRFRTLVPGSIKGKIKLEDNKYIGQIEKGCMAGNVGDLFLFKIESSELNMQGNKFFIKDKLKISMPDIGVILIRGFLNKESLRFNFLSESGLDLTKLFFESDIKILRSLNIDNMNFDIYKSSESKSIDIAGAIDTTSTVFDDKRIFKSKLKFKKTGEDLSILLKDKYQKFFLDFSARFDPSGFLEVGQGMFGIKGRGALEVRGIVPLNNKHQFDLLAKGYKIDPKFFFDKLKIKLDLISSIDFKANVKGFMHSVLVLCDFGIKGDKLEGEGSLKYGNKIFTLERISLNNGFIFSSSHDAGTGAVSLSAFLNNVNSDFCFTVLKSLESLAKHLRSKKIRYIEKNLSDSLLNGKINIIRSRERWTGKGVIDLVDPKGNKLNFESNLTEESLSIDKFSIIQDKKKTMDMYARVFFRDTFRDIEKLTVNFIAQGLKIDNKRYFGGLTGDAKKNHDGELIGDIALKEFGTKASMFSLFDTKFRYSNKILYIDKIKLDEDINGVLKIDFGDQSKILGKINLDSSRVRDFLNILNIGNYKIISGKIKSKINLKGTLKNPCLKLREFYFSIVRKKVRLNAKADIDYENKYLKIANADLTLNGKQKVLAWAHIFLDHRKESRLKLKLDGVHTNEINSFINTKGLLRAGINGDLDIRFLKNKYSVDAALDLDEGYALVFPCHALKGTIKYDSYEKLFNLKDFMLKRKGEKELEFKNGSYVKLTKQGYLICDLDLHFKNWNILGLFNGLGNMRVTGVSRNDTFKGVLNADNFWANRTNFRGKKVDFSYANKIFTFTPAKNGTGMAGRIWLKDKNVVFDQFRYIEQNKPKLVVNGTLFGDKRIDLLAIADDFPIHIIAGIVYIGFMISGDADFKLTAKESLEDPIIDIDLDIMKGKLWKLSFDNASTVLTVKKDQVLIKNLNISANNRYKLMVDGRIPYPVVEGTYDDVIKKNMILRLRSDGSNLGIFNSLFGPSITNTKGDFDIALTIGNNIFEPSFNGYMKIRNGEFGLPDGIKRMREIETDIDIKDNDIVIKKCISKIGQGFLEISGHAKLKGFRLDSFDLSFDIIKDKGISIVLNYLMIPASTLFSKVIVVPSKAILKGNLRLVGDISSYDIKGEMTLKDANFTYPPREDDSQITDFGYFLKKANWDFRLNAGANTWYENDYVSLAIDGGMTFVGSGDDLLVNGDVLLLRGDINYIGTHFTILEGGLSIINNEVYINMKAETLVQREDMRLNTTVDDTILLSIDKTKLSEIKPRFASRNYPDTSPEVAMGLAISGGATSEDMDPEVKQNYLRREFCKLIDSTLATPLIKVFLHKTGLVDFVKIKTSVVQQGLESNADDKDITGVDLLKGSSFLFGKYVNPDLFLGYSLGFTEGTTEESLDVAHEVEAKYRLNKNLYLKGLIGIDEDRGTDRRVSVEYMIPLGPKKKK